MDRNATPSMKSYLHFTEALLRPATAVMDRLKYLRKFLLIGALLVVPLAFLLRLQYQGAQQSIEFNSAERVGISYIRPLQRLLGEVQRRRILVAAVSSGVGKYASELEATTEVIDERVRDVDVVDASHGDALKTNQKWSAVKLAWTKLKATPPSDESSRTGLAALSASAIDLLVNYAGNNSNLILDPDLDSYWLMDAFVVKLPALGDKLAEAAERAATLVAKVDVDQVLELAGARRVIADTTVDLVNVGMKTAFAETKNPKFGQSPTLESNLKDPVQVLDSRVVSYATSLKDSIGVAGTEGAQRTVSLALATALVALDALANLHDKIAPELDWLCLKRVTTYEGSQRDGLVLGGAAVLILLYAFSGFFVSVRRSVGALATAAERMIVGTEEVFELDAQDELGDIATSYNQINRALREARRLRDQVEQDNRDLQDNIMDLLGVVSDASDGNLTVRAKITTGALGNVADAFNSLLESLQRLIGGIGLQLRRTNVAIEKISRASREMASGASSQTQEVLAASRLVEVMSRDIQNVSQNARIAAESAKRARDSAQAGTQGVNNVIQGMGTLRANVQAGAKKMKNLGDRSMEITSIVGTINRISEQTNMLALNAAIEAVRAGEHGRGFSIVAEQVRKLAERTAVATEEIEKLVKAIHDETTDTAEAIEQQTQFVERESELVGKAGESLIQISQVSTESAQLVAAINDVTVKQVEGVNVIVKTMDEISAIAKSTQLGAEGTASTVQELTSLSVQLMENIKRFKLGESHAEADVVKGAAA